MPAPASRWRPDDRRPLLRHNSRTSTRLRLNPTTIMPTENTPSSEPDKAPVETPAAEPVRRGLGWPAAFVLSLFLVVASVVVVFVLITRQAERGARATMEVGRQGLDALQELARAFRADEVTTNFASYRTRGLLCFMNSSILAR